MRALIPRRAAWLPAALVASLAIAASCSGKDATPTPSPTATVTPAPIVTVMPSPTATPAESPTATPSPSATTPPATSTPGSTSTPSPTSTPAAAPELQVLSPSDGAVLQSGAAWVYGRAPQDAVVAVDGEPVDVAADGSFTAPVGLDEGGNLIEVTAAKDGGVATEQISVFSVPPASGPSLDIAFPTDGWATALPSVWVMGATSPGSSVAVNGSVVDVDELGLFKVEVPLSDPVELIEVTAIGPDGASQTATVSVFFDESFE